MANLRKLRRWNAVDIHVDDWDPCFLSQIDVNRYAKDLANAGVQSILFYVNSHTGHCLFPTQTGISHSGIGARDVVREVLDACQKESIDVFLYYSMVFNNDCYQEHPDWRILDSAALASRQKAGGSDVLGGRYGVCCPNTAYRQFVFDQLREIAQRYPDCSGFFLDMVFWPEVCYCPSCRDRFKRETGLDLPLVINWGMPEWEAFQNSRESWLREFARQANEVIWSVLRKPVLHQFGATPRPWSSGFTEKMADYADLIVGDFYGGLEQESFICKYFKSIASEKPFVYITAACDSSLAEHTAYKSREALLAHYSTVLAHGGGFMFVNPIEPDGEIGSQIYEDMKWVFQKAASLETDKSGELLYDAAVLFHQESQIDLLDNGSEVEKRSHRQPHLEASVKAFELLIQDHILCGVISSAEIHRLKPGQILFCCNVERISAKECEEIAAFVKKGGSAYLSGTTDLKLLEKFGIIGQGEIGVNNTYVRFQDPEKWNAACKGIVSCYHPLCRILDTGKADILAMAMLPYPETSEKFVTIHSNPPYEMTNYPAVLYKRWEHGQIIYTACDFESNSKYLHRQIFRKLIKKLPFELSFACNAPWTIETIVLKFANKYRITFLNHLQEDRTVKVENIHCRLEGCCAKKVLLLQEHRELPFATSRGGTEFTLPVVYEFSAVEVYT